MIEFLDGAAFSGPLRPPKSRGISPIFRGKIKINDEKLRCYIKPLPDIIRCPVTGLNVSNREIISEALGYVLAKSAGLNVPDVAGVILLDTEQLPKDMLTALIKEDKGKAQENYFCWFSKDMEFPSLKQRHLEGVQLPLLRERREKRLLKKLASSPDTPKTIALDEWLLNSDRHVGNLLDASGTDLVLIDHGRILHYPNWQPGGTGSTPWPWQNRLLHTLDTHGSRWSEMLPNKSAMVLAYNGFVVSFRQHGADAARQVLAEFFDEAVNIEAIIRLLDDRLDSEQYAKTAGLVL